MITTIAFVGLIAVFLGLVLSAYAFNLIENNKTRKLRLRWIVRDFGVFIYGCVFACKYIVLGPGVPQPEPSKQGRKYVLDFAAQRRGSSPNCGSR
jgi:hypothetical protein